MFLRDTRERMAAERLRQLRTAELLLFQLSDAVNELYVSSHTAFQHRLTNDVSVVVGAVM